MIESINIQYIFYPLLYFILYYIINRYVKNIDEKIESLKKENKNMRADLRYFLSSSQFNKRIPSKLPIKLTNEK